MSLKLSLRPEQLKDLAVIRDIGPEKLMLIVEKLSVLCPPPVHPSDLQNAINEVLEGPDRLLEAHTIVGQLISLYSIRRMRGLSAQEVLDGISYGISTAKVGWDAEGISRWKDVTSQLRDLLSLTSVWNVVKGLELSYDYPNLFQNVKILTDIRPIYDEDASEIQGSIISDNLRIYYDTFSGGNSLSLAMDEKDVKKLMKVCERALKKAETAKKFMLTHDVKRTFICGEDE